MQVSFMNVHDNYINNNSLNCKQKIGRQVTFTHWNRTVFDKDVYKNLIHRNDTCFFRSSGIPNFFDRIFKRFLEKFKDSKSINVSFFGCSDGSEPASFIMYALEHMPADFISKIGQVRAIDYDPVAINKAKMAAYDIDREEIKNIKLYLGDNVEKYITNFQKNKRDVNHVYLNSVVTSKIDYVLADMFEEVKHLRPDDNILFARNFWPYLKDRQYSLAKMLDDKLQTNSMLLYAAFDTSFDFMKSFNKTNFIKSKVPFCLEK